MARQIRVLAGKGGRKAARSWYCPRCGRDRSQPVPVVAVWCPCSRRGQRTLCERGAR